MHKTIVLSKLPADVVALFPQLKLTLFHTVQRNSENTGEDFYIVCNCFTIDIKQLNKPLAPFMEFFKS